MKVQLTEVPLRQLMFTGVERERENERPSRIALFRRRAFFLLSLGGGGRGSSRVPLTPFRYPFTRSVAEPLECVADPRLTSPLLLVRMWWRALGHA